MKVDMLMPQMGESIAEATIIKWLKNPGQYVEKDEMILEISTDKVDSEIPAPASGILTRTLFGEGAVVPVKEKIAVIDTDGSSEGVSETQTEDLPEPKSSLQEAAGAESPMQTPSSNGTRAGASVTDAGSSRGRFYSPLVQSLAAKHGISLTELESIPGSGHGGRVTKRDLLNYVESQKRAGTRQEASVEVERPAPTVYVNEPAAPAREPVTERALMREPDITPSPGGGWSAEGTKIEPMDRMRQAIASHMVMSKATSPHVYSVQEVDVTSVAIWRAAHKREFKAREGFNLSYTPFFLEAAVKGLLEFPYINASVEGNTIILKKHINLGCAVALGTKGLIVPVIKKAEEKNLVGLARSLYTLALSAREKKLQPDDVAGGTFTVTNPGTFGTKIGYPIINQPQLAILSVGAIKKAPVIINNAIAIRDICHLTLSYDHRVIDGALGGSYLKFVREYLENWDTERTLF